MGNGLKMLRSEYWEKAKEILDWCNDSELKVLHQQAEKTLNKRMNSYLVKFEETEHKKRKRAASKIKSAARKVK